MITLSLTKQFISLCKPLTSFCLMLLKGLSKKLEKLGKEKGCETIQPWRKSSVNHVYWSASTSQSGEEALAKFRSIYNHVQNIHEHSNDLFPTCAHGPLDPRQWLQPSETFLLSDYSLSMMLKSNKPLHSWHYSNIFILNTTYLHLCIQKTNKRISTAVCDSWSSRRSTFG